MTPKRLYRLRTNRIIAGVAAGIADYFNIDPVIVRLLFVLMALGHGTGILIYIIAWIVIPEAPTDQEMADISSAKKATDHDNHGHSSVYAAADTTSHRQSPLSSENGRIAIGLILLAIGLIYLLQNIFGFNVWRDFWPLILVVVGLGLVVRSITEKRIDR